MPVSLCATQAYLFNIIRISYFSSTITNALFASYETDSATGKFIERLHFIHCFQNLTFHFHIRARNHHCASHPRERD